MIHKRNGKSLLILNKQRGNFTEGKKMQTHNLSELIHGYKAQEYIKIPLAQLFERGKKKSN